MYDKNLLVNVSKRSHALARDNPVGEFVETFCWMKVYSRIGNEMTSCDFFSFVYGSGVPY